MSVLDPKKTYNNLKKKGFVDSISKRSIDHKYLELYYNEKLVCYTKISHGSKEIGTPLIKQMSVQCHLDKNEFLDLSKCPLSREAFFEILGRKGLLE